ncbi:MAG: DHH family phosphoesterase, partial [Acutalibacteraceae bacterium]
MSFQKWIVKKIDNREVLNLVNIYGIPPLSAGLLISRGICNPDDIMEFILPTVDKNEKIKWYGIDKMVLEINSCINSNSKICIYGDYDADGVTATALMYEYLRYRGANVCYYIPERDRDGYGLNKNAISKLKSDDIDVIITVDNGVTAHKEIDYANQNGIKVLVTDHHKVPDVLPNAAAIVDPHIPVEGVKYCNNFAGVGVVFKIV